MNISAFDLFTIGIGPSSSHTIGPMRAAYKFIDTCAQSNKLSEIHSIKIELFGSLAFTGKGHGTDLAVLMGLEGELPETIEPKTLNKRIKKNKKKKILKLLGSHPIHFDYEKQLIFNFQDSFSAHPNALRFTAFNSSENILLQKLYYSIGGGFILEDGEKQTVNDKKSLPYPFTSAKELLDHCRKHRLTIANLMLHNEQTWCDKTEIKQKLLQIAEVMAQSIENGCHHKGILPGGLKITRRAPKLFKKLKWKKKKVLAQSPHRMNYVNMCALAVAEENAAFGRVVTAPTNGSAGIIPAVLEYYKKFYNNVTDEKIMDFLLTAAAIGILYKTGASISGAEVGCQGEVGVACSMAAGALTAVLGGSIAHIEKAAEIAMEHHLGLTCDPVAGLVQIPCIERNAIAAVKAVNITQLVLMESGHHKVTLDEVIATMKQTGLDMAKKYKETAQGGLAVNVSTC